MPTKIFIATFVFTQYNRLHSVIRYIHCDSWNLAISQAENILSEMTENMESDGVNEIQLQSLAIINP